jgi:hypothetical protein
MEHKGHAAPMELERVRLAAVTIAMSLLRSLQRIVGVGLREGAFLTFDLTFIVQARDSLQK